PGELDALDQFDHALADAALDGGHSWGLRANPLAKLLTEPQIAQGIAAARVCLVGLERAIGLDLRAGDGIPVLQQHDVNVVALAEAECRLLAGFFQDEAAADG